MSNHEINKYILDASALLALLNSEHGASIIEPLLPNSIMSTVNIAEIIAELDKKLGLKPENSKEIVRTLIDKIIPLDFDQAIEIGTLRKLTQHLGLSLGDRACINLGIKLNLPVYTADRAWSELKIDQLDVRLIR